MPPTCESFKRRLVPLLLEAQIEFNEFVADNVQMEPEIITALIANSLTIDEQIRVVKIAIQLFEDHLEKHLINRQDMSGEILANRIQKLKKDVEELDSDIDISRWQYYTLAFCGVVCCSSLLFVNFVKNARVIYKLVNGSTINFAEILTGLSKSNKILLVFKYLALPSVASALTTLLKSFPAESYRNNPKCLQTRRHYMKTLKILNGLGLLIISFNGIMFFHLPTSAFWIGNAQFVLNSLAAYQAISAADIHTTNNEHFKRSLKTP